MKPGLEIVIKSVDEPQLERCLAAVHNQTVKPMAITHYNNVIPECEAHNKCLSGLQYEWAMFVGGDFILDLDAVEKFWYYHKKMDKPNVSEFSFGLRDTFIKRVICGCAVARSEVIKNFYFNNILANDTDAGAKMRDNGFQILKFWRDNISVGTHFDNPDDFQVFRRFYARGVKAGKKGKLKAYSKYNKDLTHLYNQTQDPQYVLAWQAFVYGYRRKDYETSHDINFEREVFETWKKSQ